MVKAVDKKAGEAESKVGNFFFKSKYAKKFWHLSAKSPFYVVRLVGAVLISMVFAARCARLFLRTR